MFKVYKINIAEEQMIIWSLNRVASLCQQKAENLCLVFKLI